MKMNEMNKKLILAAALSLGAAGLSDAATVYLTGSTAIRSSVQAALQSVGTGPTNVFSALTSSTFWENNNYMAFVGTASAAAGGGALTVQCHWSGSEAGINDMANSNPEQFLSDTGSDGANHGTNSPTGANIVTGIIPDLAMADNNQASSQFSKPTVNTNAEVCVIPFTFVRNPGVWLGTNISHRMFQQSEFFFCPRAVFDGDQTHTNDFVYISGRDNKSGTRVNTFGDTGFGPGTTPASQIEMDTAGNMSATFGDVGFSSGGTLASTMGASTVGKDDLVAGTTGQGYSVVAYLSRGDANTAISSNAVELAYDGVVQSRANVLEGTHSLWGNEYIFQRNGAAVTAQNVYKVLGPNGGINSVLSPTSTTAIRLGDMHCTRSSPFAAPAHN
jgi:hypothetical protein